MAFDVSWIYRIVDRYTPTLKKINRITANARKGFAKSKKSLDNLSKSMANVRSAVAGVAGIAVVAFPTAKAMEFEDIMIDVQKVVSFKSKDAFIKFREGVLKTAVTLGRLPVAIGQIAVEGGKLGILPKNLQEFIDLTARTSIAFDIMEGEAANKLGSIKTKMGLTVKATGELMDAVNFLADNSATSGKRVLEVIARTIGTMKTIKMPPELVAGWAAFADQMEVSPELAASGLNMMVMRMMKMPGMMRKLLKDPQKTMRDFLGKLAKMPELRRSKRTMKLFGDEAGRFALKAVSSLKLLDKTLGFVSVKTKFAGSMMKELTKKMGAASTSVRKIKAIATVTMIQLGDALLPIIKEMTPAIVSITSKIRDFIKNNPGIVKMVLIVGAITTGFVIGAIALGIFLKGIALLIGLILAITSPIGMVIAAIAGLVLIGKMIYDNWSSIGVFFTEMWGTIVNTFNSAVSAIGEAAKLIWKEFSKALDNPFLATIMTIFAPFLAIPALIFKHWEPIKEFFGGIFDKISDVTSSIGGFLGFGSEDEIGGKSAKNAAMKGQINGRIEVAASPGSEIVVVDIESLAIGNVGLNMAEAQ